MWDPRGSYTRIKLCWFETLDSAYEADGLGVDALGYHIFTYDDWQQKVDRFQFFFQHMPHHTDRVLLTDLDLDTLARVFERVRFDSVQLYPDWEPAAIDALRAIPGAPQKILKVMSAIPAENFTADNNAFLSRYATAVDGILLDSCREGGSGKTSDWSEARKIVETSRVPVFLAGGLSPQNVDAAIRAVRPFGVDLESGVSTVLSDPELPYLKDLGKCRALVDAVMQTDRALQREAAGATTAKASEHGQ